MQGAVLPLVVGLAVDPGVSEEAGGGEGLLARGTLQTLLVPGRAVDPHEEAVRDDPCAAFTHGLLQGSSSCRRHNKKPHPSGCVTSPSLLQNRMHRAAETDHVAFPPESLFISSALTE